MDHAAVPEQIDGEQIDSDAAGSPVVNHEADDAAGSPVVDYEAERAADLATLARVEAGLAEIEQAMRAIEEGTYGVCEQCQAPIPEEVLMARPTARRCAAHVSEPATSPAPPTPPAPPPDHQDTR